jgi:hypothetical protein
LTTAMRLRHVVILAQLFSCVSISAAAEPHPDAVVRQLYRLVVALHPIGLPTGADKAAIWPLLNKRLVSQFDTAKACQDDWFSQNPGDSHHHAPQSAPPAVLKPEFAWLEEFLFSGTDEETAPAAVVVGGTKPQRDGSFRVNLQFVYADSPSHWRGAIIVRSEDGRFVVDDVLVFKENSTKIESRLSHILTLGCDGPRWVGYGKARSR